MSSFQLKIVVRSLFRHKLRAIISILTLSIGVAIFLLLNHYVYFEKSYDTFLNEPENLYRVNLKQFLGEELALHSAENYPAVGPALMEELPEVLANARLYNLGYKNNVVIATEPDAGEPIAIKQRKFLYADSSFLPMMGYQMALGDASTALSEPLSAVISEEMAGLYFGNQNPIGQFLRMQDDDRNNELCQVTGVFKNLPQNTHLKFDVLFSYKTLFTRGDYAVPRYDQSWRRKDMYTYVRLREGHDPLATERKLPGIIDKYANVENKLGTDSLELVAVNDIHLKSNLAEESEINSDIDMINALSVVMFFILLIAWINYVNISTSQAMYRAKEVGIRKTTGAHQSQLMIQFLFEAAVINAISILIGWILAGVVLPYFNQTTGYQFQLGDIFNARFFLISLGLWIVGTLLSGFYPAFLLSSFKPLQVLRGKFVHSSAGNSLRKFLVVFQYAASMMLITGTLVVYQQIRYMINQDIGMTTEQILVVERPGVVPGDQEAYENKIELFRNQVKSIAQVENVAASLTIPGKKRKYMVSFKRPEDTDDQAVMFRWNSMDFDFVDVFDMEVLAGTVYTEDKISEQENGLVITESGARKLGYTPESIIGETITAIGFDFRPKIIGVVNDYNQESLKSSAESIAFFFSQYSGEFFSIKMQTDSYQQALGDIEQTWNEVFPGNPFLTFFLDDFFNRLYINEQRFANLSLSFSVIAIFLASLGLFGLSTVHVQQQIKEIGIRKVLGSSSLGIYFSFTKDFLKLVVIGFLIATPLSYLLMQNWLENFAYNSGLGVGTFITSIVVIILSAVLATSFHTLKASHLNPVDALRYE